MNGWRAGLAMGALLIAAGCGGSGSDSPPAGPKTFVASGSLTLLAGGAAMVGDNCGGVGGYDDIQKGASVIVTDASGKKLALGTLDDGQPGGSQTCTFRFAVDGIKSGVGPYSIEVSHRGQTAFSESDASSLALTLG